jgi:oxygen-independent coproporphyrinogen-3 oxidase
MPIFKTLPLSLYIHLPWCVQKCPYCDFNSHKAAVTLPEELYVGALLQELKDHLPLIKDRTINTVFFGGGTPSLFSGKAINAILTGVKHLMPLKHGLEITLEANPGKVDLASFDDYLSSGVDRLSLGVQSFQNDKLQSLGRIHDRGLAIDAIKMAKEAGFMQFNIDLMYGLPNQSQEDALSDLETALTFGPPHLSWYQLTIEPNTLFHHKRPTLPDEDAIWEMQLKGQALLKEGGLDCYEVSAYARIGSSCAHNLNYWEFGDYLGIGAGASSKITYTQDENTVIYRFSQVKHPKDYLDPQKRKIVPLIVSQKDLAFEFMLNALRLTDGVPTSLFSERTGLPLDAVSSILECARNKGLLCKDDARIKATPLGFRFLNDLIAMFL